MTNGHAPTPAHRPQRAGPVTRTADDAASRCMVGKRAALLISSEESYVTATAAVAAQLHEMSGYLQQDLVAVVNGVGNTRGEVRSDPSDPLTAARTLGGRLFELRHSDYTILAERSNHVWPDAGGPMGYTAWGTISGRRHQEGA